MLGSLARHLRFYGFDVTYKTDFTHYELELEASIANTPLITTAKTHHYWNCWQLPFSSCTNVLNELNFLFNMYKLDQKIDISHTRCGLCNTLLKEVFDVERIKTVLPQKTLEYYLDHISKKYQNNNEKFSVWYCTTCDKYYWQGSHWQNILGKIQHWIG